MSATKTEAPIAVYTSGARHAQSFVDFVPLRVQILDVRSGRPIAGRKIQRANAPATMPRTAPLTTDANGIATFRLGVSEARAGARVSVCADDFAMVRESSVAGTQSREASELFRAPSGQGEGGTDFVIAWRGPQQPPAWGWRVTRRECASAPVESWAEFRTVVDLCLPSNAEATHEWWRLAGGDLDAYCRSASDPEIVLFALQYSNPVWFDLPKDEAHSPRALFRVAGGAAVVESIAANRSGVFLTSRCRGTGKDNGRDFATFVPHPSQETATRMRRGQPKPHLGIDIAGVEGHTPVFAVSTGRVSFERNGLRYEDRWKIVGEVNSPAPGALVPYAPRLTFELTRAGAPAVSLSFESYPFSLDDIASAINQSQGLKSIQAKINDDGDLLIDAEEPFAVGAGTGNSVLGFETGLPAERKLLKRGGLGNNARLSVDSKRLLIYAHLESFSGASARRVRAGELLGTTGRWMHTPASGPDATHAAVAEHKYTDSPTHLHLEYKVGGSPCEPRLFIDEDKHHGAANQKVVPGNDHVRMFPCDTSGSKDRPEQCWRRTGSVARNARAVYEGCWARLSAVCPYERPMEPEEIRRALAEQNHA